VGGRPFPCARPQRDRSSGSCGGAPALSPPVGGRRSSAEDLRRDRSDRRHLDGCERWPARGRDGRHPAVRRHPGRNASVPQIVFAVGAQGFSQGGELLAGARPSSGGGGREQLALHLSFHRGDHLSHHGLGEHTGLQENRPGRRSPRRWADRGSPGNYKPRGLTRYGWRKKHSHTRGGGQPDESHHTERNPGPVAGL
jgi:hypothetical protein